MASPAPIEALSAAQAAQFESAFRLLSAGNVGGALAIASRLSCEAPHAPDAHQLVAMCHADAGNIGEAVAGFRRALELVPGNALILVNYGTLLRKVGRLEEALVAFRQAAEAAPNLGKAWIELGLTALQLDKRQQAQSALARAVGLQPDSALAWHALGNAQRAQGEIEAAASAFRRAVSLKSDYATAWANLGAVLRLLGRADEALGCFERAGHAGHASAELADGIVGTLLDCGRLDEALERAKALTQAYSDFAPGHLTLAHILWEHADAANAGAAVAGIRTAVQQRPNNRELRNTFARFLLAARLPEDALSQIRILQADDNDPQLVRLEADTLEVLGRTAQAGGLYAKLHRTLATDPVFLNAYARHLLRVGNWQAAAERASEATRVDPGNQEAWAYLGTAWRLLEDPREHWLCNYERLIGLVEVAPPAGYSGVPEFLSALTATLEPLHRATREPVLQTLRGGSQTPGRLFGRPDPVIDATRHALIQTVERWLQALPADVSHPFLARNARRVRLSGSWSVRLWSSGSHVNHIHPEGWMSSAFYVSLPPSVTANSTVGSAAGCIQFGQPPLELELDLPPRRVIRPEVGRLALFPSFMWHGTVPFIDEQPRLTIAFDMVPSSR